MKNGKVTTFLVDDDEMYLEMLTDKIKLNPRLRLKTFSNGEDCINNLSENPEIVILDYKLNKDNSDAKNGIEILRKIKQAKPNIEVIILSSQEKIEIAVETIKQGAYTYVVKNETAFERLRIVIHNILHKFHLQRSNKLYRKQRVYLVIALVIVLLVNVLNYLFNPDAFKLW
ncbi:MAG: response regulator [Bacteroidia bacterium]|nr:response regulator [Bacteroidia bacterium]